MVIDRAARLGPGIRRSHGLALDIGSLSTNSMRHAPSNFTLSGFYLTCGLQW
jgi:hypothetical protein